MEWHFLVSTLFILLKYGQGGVCTGRAAMTLIFLSQAHLIKAYQTASYIPGKSSAEGSMGRGKKTVNFLVVCNLSP